MRSPSNDWTWTKVKPRDTPQKPKIRHYQCTDCNYKEHRARVVQGFGPCSGLCESCKRTQTWCLAA